MLEILRYAQEEVANGLARSEGTAPEDIIPLELVKLNVNEKLAAVEAQAKAAPEVGLEADTSFRVTVPEDDFDFGGFHGAPAEPALQAPAPAAAEAAPAADPFAGL